MVRIAIRSPKPLPPGHRASLYFSASFVGMCGHVLTFWPVEHRPSWCVVLLDLAQDNFSCVILHPLSLFFFLLLFFFFVCWLDAEILDGCLDHKIFSVYPPPLSSKPGNSFLDCRAGFHGSHVGVLLCRYLEFCFLPSDKVRHHTCPFFSSSQNTLAFPALWSHLLFCPFPLFFCIFRKSFQ